MNHIRISVVTPNYNGEKFLEKTIVSVLSQNYPNLDYIIVDGKSTDGSMRIVEKYTDRLAHVVSEPDKGHADAVNKGFALASGEVMGWINSDDMLFPGSLALINEVFSQFPDVDWITGRAASMLESDEVNVIREVRPWSWLRFLCGDFRHIQQESTFWRRSLWNLAGGGLSLKYSLANDFDLWSRFFRYAALYSVDRKIGCFREREGQRSVAMREQYNEECDMALLEMLDAIPVGLLAKHLHLLPVDRILHPSFNFPEVPVELAVADPPIIRFDHATQCYSRPDFSVSLPCTFEPKEEVRREDLRFDGSEHVFWTDGPDFVSHDLTGLDVELHPTQSVAVRGDKFTESTPPMPVIIGPLALYDLGGGKYYIQISYTGKVIGQNISLGSSGKSMRFKFIQTSERYAIIANGKMLAAGEIAGQQLVQSRYARMGGGYLFRFWKGVIHKIHIAFQSQFESKSVIQSVAIAHEDGRHSFQRKRVERSVQIGSAVASVPAHRLNRA